MEEPSGADPSECPFCEGEISATAKKCRHCGEWVARDCLLCGTPVRREWAAAGRCASCQAKMTLAAEVSPVRSGRSRVTAGLLGLLLGGIGVHKFYLGKTGQGVLYLLLCWTFIPAVIGLVEGVAYLASSDESFQAKFG